MGNATGASRDGAADRRIALWVPDWPIVALRRSGAPIGEDAPAAVLRGGAVVACSREARADGVRRGMRRRDAQSHCPQLRLADDDPARDAREFLAVADRVEERVPGLQLIRPGLAVLRARGAARHYGGELPAALTLVRTLRGDGLDARAGVADGRFAAEQAARRTAATGAEHPGVRIVPPGGDAEFLAPLPVTALGDEALAELLARLGIPTLGAFAALPADAVLERFGPSGALRHDLAAGVDPHRFTPREPIEGHAVELAFEPPLTLAEQVAFATRTGAERFVAGLAAARLVCTELRVVLRGDDGDRCERVWTHADSFDASAVVDRVRWQVDGVRDGLRGGVVAVRLEPEAVGGIGAHEPGLYGRADDRVGAALARLQAQLGHRGVLTATIGGGRRLADRVTLTPWGERRGPEPAPRRSGHDAAPWPGSLPAPHPAAVYPDPVPVEVSGERGEPVLIDPRGSVSCAPAWILLPARLAPTGARTGRGAPGARRRVTAWGGPWPLVEHGWDRARARRAHRFQIVDEAGSAWALLADRGGWLVEGRYG